MTRTAWAALPLMLFLGPGAARAAPDPMSAGSLQRVEVHAMNGAVRVKIEKTQHVHLDGKERDARRDGKTLVVRRMSGDVALTVPPHVILVVSAASGDVMIEGEVRDASLQVASGDVAVTGEVKTLHVEAASGDVRLKIGLTEGARVQVALTSGDIALVARGKTPFTLDASAVQGSVTGQGLGTQGASAKVKLRAMSGDVSVTRAE